MLIAVSGGGCSAISELQLRRLLENVSNCMVLVLGQEELTNIRNVERLKRELRSCYRLIDILLERVNDEKGFMGDLTQCADCLLLSPSGLLQEALDSFAQAAESEFGCLLVHGRVALATEKWWSRLTSQEVVVLSVLVHSLSGASSCDYPVFLPQGSPTVAIRLLSFQLLPGVHVCVLCGPKPSLYKAENELIGRFWSTFVENLRSCLEQAKRSTLPPSVSLRWDIQALLLINRESRRAVTVCPHVRSGAPSEATPLLSSARRLELLRLFYTFAVTRYFTSQETSVSSASTTSEDFSQGFTHVPVQCYLVTDECKCYGLQSSQHQLFLLMDLSVPTFALRTAATQTLSAITAATGF